MPVETQKAAAEAKPQRPLLRTLEGVVASDKGDKTIKVVVNVVYTDETQNVSDAQIKSQIAALNKDFRATNPDRTKTPTPFKGLAPFEASDVDALLFFGRDRERELIVANLLASRLTVLYGPAGVTVDVIDYGESGRLALAGRAAPGAGLRVYLDNTLLGSPQTDRQGDAWDGERSA